MKIFCPKCKLEMISKIGRYFYKDVGLTNVYIENIPVYSCPCGTEFASIFQVGKLNDLIAKELLKKPALLDGSEIRFLRKNLKLSAKTFARKMGVAVTTYSKWENDRQGHRETNDRLIRATYMIAKDMDTIESKDIINRLSGKNLRDEYIDPLIIAKKIDDSYVLFRESLQTSSASLLTDIYLKRLASTSSTLESRQQLKTERADKIEIMPATASASDIRFEYEKTGTC